MTKQEKIQSLIDEIEELRDDLENLKEHIKAVRHSHAMLFASRQTEGPL